MLDDLRHLMNRGRRLAACTGGGVLIYTALLTPVAFGLAGLGMDVASWHLQRWALQNAADAAALGGALEILRRGDATSVRAAALTDARMNAADPGRGDRIEVRYPPVEGPNAGAGDAVEVVVERPAPLYFTRLFLDTAFPIRARAVARADLNDTCVWALNPEVRAAAKVAGGAVVQLNCGILVNSRDVEALTQGGSGCLRATKIKVAGGAGVACAEPLPLTGVTPKRDPLADLPPPPVGPCDHHAKIKVNGGETLTLQPGVYCGAIEVASDGAVHFEPGLYVLEGAGLSFSAQSTVTGSDVSFYLTENARTADNISIQAGANVQLASAEDGALPGVLFYQSRNSPSNITHNLTGGSTMDLEGILYFPNQDLKFAGGTEADKSGAIIIADVLDFTGNSFVGDLEDSPVQKNPQLIVATLVE
jgi:hypothetical protein